MGIGLSLLSIYEVVRISVPTCAESVVGKVTREKCDERLQSFGDRLLGRARTTVEVEGIENVPMDRSLVFMSNHQSLVDIPVLFKTIPHSTIRMVGKQELSKVPIWGRAAKAAGMVYVDRSNREKAVASLKAAAETMRSGVSIWISPEGTRSRTGKLGPLKRGGFHLAKQTGSDILPIALLGTETVLPRKGAQMAYDQTVRVVFGEPIHTADANVDELQADVRRFLLQYIPDGTDGQTVRAPAINKQVVETA